MSINRSRFLFLAVLLACLLVTGCGGPGVPGNVRSLVDDSSVWVSWTSSTGATNYLVYKSESSGGAYSLVGSTANTWYEVPGLVNGTPYYFVVKAADTKKESAYSAEVSATPVAADVKDDFESYTTSLSDPWTSVFGSVAIGTDGSKVVYLDYGSAMYVHSSVSQADCAVSIMARGNSALTNTMFNVVARYSGTAPLQSYYVFAVSAADGQAQLVKSVAGAGDTIESVDLPAGFDFSVYHTLRFEVQGSTLNGYIDGQLVVTATDTTVPAAGSAGFAILNGMAYFDNFRVFYE